MKKFYIIGNVMGKRIKFLKIKTLENKDLTFKMTIGYDGHRF